MGMPIDMFFSYIYIHSQYYSIEKTIHDIYIYINMECIFSVDIMECS